MEIALASKRKLGLVTGALKRDPEDAELQERWDTCNFMVIAWLTASMSPSVKELVMFVQSAREVWYQLETRFSQTNGTRKYKLSKYIYDLRQTDKTISEYYTIMNSLWDELEGLSNYPAITNVNEEIRAFLDALFKQEEEKKLFQFSKWPE